MKTKIIDFERSNIYFIRKSVASLLLAFMVFSIMGNAVTLANNSSDTEFNFSFYNGVQNCTEGRQKTDTSKIYMKCTSITEGKSYIGYAMGYRTPTGGNAMDCSRGFGYEFRAGVYHYMTNWVKENGYYYAGIKAVPSDSVNFTASGKWSPDNVNQY